MRTGPLPVLLLAPLGVLVACAAPPIEPPRPVDLACFPPEAHFVFLATDTRLFRQGATVRITPTADVAPAGVRELPPRCATDWRIAGPARLNGDRTAFTIDADAPPGSEVVVGFLHGARRIEGRYRVIARDAVVLTGTWSQRGIEGCGAPEPVRELEFRPDGSFAVTFLPFETYRDYWGRYTFDPATGALTMSVEGGNHVPAGLDLEGRAEREGERLTLRGVYLGDRHNRPAGGDCVYRF